jgi:hypothetical protein
MIKSIRNLLSNISQSAKTVGEIRGRVSDSVQHSKEIRDGVANQSSLINDKLIELIRGLKNQTDVINRKLTQQNIFF